MSTDTAQAQAHEILNEPFPNIPAMRRCIAGLLADLEERDRTTWEVIEILNAKLVQARYDIEERDELVKDTQEELRVCQQEAITVTAQLAQAHKVIGDLQADCHKLRVQLTRQKNTLRDASAALWEEVRASDLDHPIIKAHMKVAKRCDAALAQEGEK